MKKGQSLDQAKEQFKESKKEKKPSTDSMNYNDRPDGYGFGEAESMDDELEYQSDPDFCKHCKDMGEGYRPHKDEPYTKDELGLRNPYGPMDQYVFRDSALSKNKKHPEKGKEKSS